jgi:uncharacterized protein YfkK (UPF0435 family)
MGEETLNNSQIILLPVNTENLDLTLKNYEIKLTILNKTLLNQRKKKRDNELAVV